MVVVIEEDDAGTKKKAKDAIKKLKDDLKDGTIIAKELDKVWKRIRNDAKMMCPKDTGLLASTIRISKLPSGAMIGGLSRVKDVTIFDKTIVAGDMTKINRKSGKPCDYAVWVHDGHKLRDGSFWSGVPFLSEAIAMHEDELEKAIQRALKKLGKKYSKI